ncbi:MAG TPA: squalene/phytoene synthase family protein, partial [Pseudonocardiaceae bacterium]|nr:squalene/phytoene synthase family protein [Pseudonocardiaceae bacterium]
MTLGVSDTLTLEAAYQRCERITADQARNFSYGIRLLPASKRRALSAVYAFARRVDDIGDSAEPDDVRLAGLADVRAQLHDLDCRRDDPVLVALADTARRTGLPLLAFDELIDGCEADVRGTLYTTFEELHGYCRCVAGSIGRLSLA